MKNHRLLFAALVFLLLPASGPAQQVQTRKIPKEFVEFGRKRIDNYFWLSDRTDSVVIQHLRAENAYTEAMLSHTAGLQQKIYAELAGRIEQKYASLPVKKNGYWYYVRYEEGKQYPLYCRKKGELGGAEEVFLDVPRMAAGHQIYMVRGYQVSPANRWLAFGIDTTGDRQCALRIKDLATSNEAPEVIANTSGNYAWANDNQTIFYVLNDPTIRAFKVMSHKIGTDPANDRHIYSENDSTFSVFLSTTRDRAYIFIGSGSTLSSEWRYIDADRPDAPPVLIQPRQKEMLYSMEEHEGETFFIHTNKDARNFKLVAAPINSPGMENWRDVIAHRPDALLEQALVFTNYLVAQQKIGGLTQILIIDRRTQKSAYLEFSEPAYVASMYAATDACDLDSIRYTYTSLTTPRSDFFYSLASGKKALLKQEKIGGGYDPSLYETRRIWATGADSVRVPVSIVYRASLFKHDGSNPLLLYAYGSYGASSEPWFNSSVISLLDRGFVYGIAHIRGGQEMGRQWYEDGKLLSKKNTFADYVTCAQHLVDQKYTSTDRLFANGGERRRDADGRRHQHASGSLSRRPR